MSRNCIVLLYACTHLINVWRHAIKQQSSTFINILFALSMPKCIKCRVFQTIHIVIGVTIYYYLYTVHSVHINFFVPINLNKILFDNHVFKRQNDCTLCRSSMSSYQTLKLFCGSKYDIE